VRGDHAEASLRGGVHCCWGSLLQCSAVLWWYARPVPVDSVGSWQGGGGDRREGRQTSMVMDLIAWREASGPRRVELGSYRSDAVSLGRRGDGWWSRAAGHILDGRIGIPDAVWSGSASTDRVVRLRARVRRAAAWHGTARRPSLAVSAQQNSRAAEGIWSGWDLEWKVLPPVLFSLCYDL
jgi:hypothetical protein